MHLFYQLPTILYYSHVWVYSFPSYSRRLHYDKVIGHRVLHISRGLFRAALECELRLYKFYVDRSYHDDFSNGIFES